MGGFEDVAGIATSVFTIALIDDHADSVSELDDFLKSNGFSTTYGESVIEIEKMFNSVRTECQQGVIMTVPALDLRFDQAIELTIDSSTYRVKNPFFTGLEILEQEVLKRPELKNGCYILMSSIPIDGEIEKRLDKLKRDGLNIESFRKTDPSEEILSKICRLLIDPSAVLITGLIKSFNTFCDAFGIEAQQRHILLGANSPRVVNDTQRFRKYLVDSADAQSRISCISGIELAVRALYPGSHLAQAMSNFRLRDGRSGMDILISGELSGLEMLKRELEIIFGTEI